jgi:probable F420-dependent oxidoreductase
MSAKSGGNGLAQARMRIGFTLPQFGSMAYQAREVGRFAREVERAGAASIWVGDLLLCPLQPKLGYEGAPDFPDQFRAQLDPLVLLTAAAMTTERVRLGTSVMNGPWYPPVLLARAATSIDQLSGGRLLLGLGAGWSPDQFEAAGVPMSERGDRLDECLDVLAACWAGTPVSCQGRRVRIEPARMDLTPHQVPVYLAGFAARAQRRVAERADGWLPVVVVGDPQGPPDLQAEVVEPWWKIRALAEQAGRDPDRLDLVLRVNPLPGADLRLIADLIRAADGVGIEDVFVELMYLAGGVDAALDWAGEILAAVGER